MTTAREAFRKLYGEARHYRSQRMLHGELLRGAGFDVFVSDTDVVVGRPGVRSDRGAFYVNVSGNLPSPGFRHYCLRRSRESGPVPLPR